MDFISAMLQVKGNRTRKGKEAQRAMVTSHLERGVNTGRIQGTEGSLEKRGGGGQARERQRQYLSCTCSVPQCSPQDTRITVLTLPIPHGLTSDP